jgi:glycosyltransferase involved in cell wall biosynthesis
MIDVSAKVDKPLISVALLCFNHEDFVAEALDGLFAQTYSPLEILIVDDGSKDRTVAVIEAELAKRSKRSDVRFLRHGENKGGEAACRTGLQNTTGGFIHIAAGDDVMFPEMIEELARVWVEENVSLVVANASYIDERSRSLERLYRDPSGQVDASFETLARDGANACCFAPTMAFERELYATFGWPPSTFLKAYDIMLPFYSYLLKGARFVNRPLLNYRVHSGNTSLSLLAEKSDAPGRLAAREQIFNGHLAHAIFMMDELMQLSAEKPERYGEVANRIMPLLTIQTVEMARKLIKSRIEISNAQRSSRRPPVDTRARPSEKA